MPINYKEYPPDWKKIRERILIRAKDRCENCGAINHSYIKRKGYNWELCLPDEDETTKIVLTIAHLDHDKHNWQVKDEQLRALCQRCHLQYDLPRHTENRKYGRNFRKNQLKINL